METLITNHWAAMGEHDREHSVKLVVDEWGAWYKPGTRNEPDAPARSADHDPRRACSRA